MFRRGWRATAAQEKHPRGDPRCTRSPPGQGSRGWPPIPPLRGYPRVTSGRFQFECGTSGFLGFLQGMLGNRVLFDGRILQSLIRLHRETTIRPAFPTPSSRPSDGDPRTQARGGSMPRSIIQLQKTQLRTEPGCPGDAGAVPGGVRSVGGRSPRQVLGRWDFGWLLPAPRDVPGARSIPGREQPGRGDARSRDLRAAGQGHFATVCQILQNFTHRK